MARTPKDILNRIRTILSAWESLRPRKSFSGVTLNDFKAAIAPCMKAREQLLEIDRSQRLVIANRDAADLAVHELIHRIVNAVKADREEGDDGELYAAMGYVRKSMRSTGLTRRRRNQAGASKGSSDGSALP